MKSLRFYNKEGYPYNFQYNDTLKKWEGKLLFDHNSSDLYKTLGVYIFEEVESIEFSEYLDYNKFEFFNSSGITFRSQTKTNVSIENIVKVNSSELFHTKWVMGKGFHQLFPVGSVIKFNNIVWSNPTPLTDFNSDVYYNVIGSKRDAIMVETITPNNVFNGMVFSSGAITSYNVIKYPDYNNNYYTYIINNFFTDKKISVVNSEKNDGVKTIEQYYSGTTVNRLSKSIYDYALTGDTTQYINLEVELFTERPMVYDGQFSMNGNTIKFGKPFKNAIQIGQELIFEDYSGNKLFNGNSYVVSDIIDEIQFDNILVDFYITEQLSENELDLYYAKLHGNYPDIKNDDIIYFSNSNGSLNLGVDFKILNVEYIGGDTILRLEQSVHVESGLTYSITNKLKFYELDTITVTGIPYVSSHSGIAYLTTNKLNYKQQILPQTSGYTLYEETIQAFASKYKAELNSRGINCYYLNGKLYIDGLYDYQYKKYFNPVLTLRDSNDAIIQTINSNYLDSILGVSGMHYFMTSDKLYNESVYLYETNKLATNYHEEIIFNLQDDTKDYGFSLTINGMDYYIPFNDYSGLTNNTQETINDFIDKYKNILYNNGINIYSGMTVDNTLYIETLYPNIRIIELKVKVNSYSTYTLKYKEQNDIIKNPIILSGNYLTVNGSTDLYSVGLSTGMIISLTGNTYNENQKEYNIIGLTNSRVELSYQGAFFSDYNVLTTVTSREFIRMPRESYDKDIYYKVSWLNTPDNLYDENIFYYDLSGEQLAPPKDNVGSYIESLRYVGQKPLFNPSEQNIIRLNKEPNTKLEYISNPKYQQTVFDTLQFLLPQKDSNDDFGYLPKPIEIFIGYNSPDEGVHTNIMLIHKVESLQFSGVTGLIDNYFIFDSTGVVEFKSNDFIGFNNMGFEIGQLVSFKFTDTSIANQIIFENIDTYEILNVTKNKLTLDIKSASNKFNSFNTMQLGRNFNYSVKVEPKEIARFSIFGETEMEDERFLVNLKNLGIGINAEEEKIFRQSDIDEYGIDYELLNRKRKEMLLIYPEIFNYIGSYKSLINAINYFGYADLELYEYYKNVNINSPLYKKYFRIHIPDMFDKSVEGWSEYDFIKSKGNRNNYQKTNLFNLTYKITDEDGNNLNLYSLKEVQVKLQNLKKWLRENILPLSSNIQDITGVGKVKKTISVIHDCSNRITKLRSSSSSMVVNFNYIGTLSFNTSYLFTINFYTVDGSIPSHFQLIVKTFSKNSDGQLIPVQYFKLFKNDLSSFNFNIDKVIDPYIYIETTYYNDYGVGVKNNKFFNADESKTYYLINNNFKYKYYPRLSTEIGYYIIDDDGQIWIVEEYSG